MNFKTLILIFLVALMAACAKSGSSSNDSGAAGPNGANSTDNSTTISKSNCSDVVNSFTSEALEKVKNLKQDFTEDEKAHLVHFFVGFLVREKCSLTESEYSSLLN